MAYIEEAKFIRSIRRANDESFNVTDVAFETCNSYREVCALLDIGDFLGRISMLRIGNLARFRIDPCNAKDGLIRHLASFVGLRRQALSGDEDR